jgi:hypothetical protein
MMRNACHAVARTLELACRIGKTGSDLGLSGTSRRDNYLSGALPMTTTILANRADAQSTHPRFRSVGAVAAGLFANAILAAVADQILVWFGVFPPWGQITYEPVPYVLALTYRTVFGVAGAYITARLAARSPMRHALALGVVGLVLSLAGIVAAVVKDVGPVWYPVVLLVITMPAAWLGGRIHAIRVGRER